MNSNNSSSELKEDEQGNDYIEDFNPMSYEEEIQKIKCENFQLRLMCYNYECTITEMERTSKDNCDIVLQQSYDKKVQKCEVLEKSLKSLQKENLELKEKLDDYINFEDEKRVLNVQDNGTQLSLLCINCKEKEIKLKRTSEEFSKKIIELENLNFQLLKSLEEIKSSIVKIETVEFSCNTEKENNYSDNDAFNSDFESDSINLEKITEMPLTSQMQYTLLKINDFLLNYKKSERKLKELENDMISTMQYKIYNDTITDDKYKVFLFNDEIITTKEDNIGKIIQKCFGQILKSDHTQLNAFLSDSEEEISGKEEMVKLPNPNFLLINSILANLNQRHEETIKINEKVKNNAKWTKHVLFTKKVNLKDDLKTNIEDSIDSHIKLIMDLSSQLTKMIPIIKLTFSKSFEYMERIDNEGRSMMMDDHHQNEELFLDNYKIFLQAASTCLLALNKEKAFLSISDGKISFPHVDICNQDVIVEVINSFMEEESPIFSPVQLNKETFVDKIICNDVFSQTLEYKTISQSTCNISHILSCTIMPDVNENNELEELRSPSAVTNETFTIDEIKYGRRIFAGAGGDVVSDSIGVNNLNDTYKKVNNYTSMGSDTLVTFQGTKDQNSEFTLRRIASLRTFENNDCNTEIIDNIVNVHNKMVRSISRENNMNYSYIPSYLSLTPKTRTINSSQNTCFSLHDSTIDINSEERLSEESFQIKNISPEILSQLKLRIMKLFYIHDLRKFTEAVSKKDNFITDEISTINRQLSDSKSRQWIIDSQLYFEIQKSINQWKDQVYIFNNWSQKCSNIPESLLHISENDFILNMLFQRESKLDFQFLKCENSIHDTDQFVSLNYLLEELGQRYEVLKDLYNHILVKKTLLRFHLSENNVLDNEISDTQYETILLEKEALLKELQDMKTEYKTHVLELMDGNLCIKKELEKSISENLLIKCDLNKKIDDENTKFKESKNEINQLIQSNINIKEKINILLRNNEDLKNTNIQLENEIFLKKQDNEKYKNDFNENNRKLLEIEEINKIYEKENCIIKEHEKQLLNSITVVEQALQKNNDKISILMFDLNTSQTIISDQKIQINNNDSEYRKNILNLENTLEQVKKKSQEMKNKISLLEEELEITKLKMCSEMSKYCEIHNQYKSIEKELGRIQLQLNLKKEELHSATSKLSDYESYKSYIDQLQEKSYHLINEIIDLIVEIDSTISKNYLECKFKKIHSLEGVNQEEIKSLTAIIFNIDNMTQILRKEIRDKRKYKREYDLIKKERFVQVNLINKADEHVLNINKTAYDEFVERRYYEERTIDASKTHSVESFNKLTNNFNKFHGKNNLNVMNSAPEKPQPVPMPRMHSITSFQSCTNNKFIIQKNEKNKSDIDEIPDHERSSNSETNDNTSRISEHLTFPLDKQVPTKFFQNSLFMLQSLLTSLYNDNSLQNTDEFKELCDIVRKIDIDRNVTSTISQADVLSKNQSLTYDKSNIEKLIDTNSFLTCNMMRSTEKILSLQEKMEIINIELRKSQIAKHEMSVELSSKYQKLSQIQSELANIKKDTKNTILEEQETQTVSIDCSIESDFNNVVKKNSSKNHILFCQPDQEQRETSSNISENNLNKFEEIPTISKSCSFTDCPNNTLHVKTDFEGDWNDVTRTMIKCLTTLSEVQETLVTPPLEEDSFGINSCLNTSLHETDCSHQNAEKSNLLTSRTKGIKDINTVKIVAMKESKYQIICRIILKMKEYFKSSEEVQVLENTEKTLLINQIEKLIRKMSSILINGVIIRELSLTSWQSLVEERIIDNVPLFVSNTTDNNSGNNPLEATERVQGDIVRLQLRLEKYQRRYKSLKNAVMANKYKFNESGGFEI